MSGPRALVGRHPVVAFFALAFFLSWAVWVPFALFDIPQTTLTFILFIAGGFGPALSAAVVTWVVGASVLFAAPHFFNLVGAGLTGLFATVTIFLVSVNGLRLLAFQE